MTMQQHPGFEAWQAALLELNRAKEVYQSSVAFNARADWIEHAKLLTQLAQENFDRLTERMTED